MILTKRVFGRRDHIDILEDFTLISQSIAGSRKEGL